MGKILDYQNKKKDRSTRDNYHTPKDLYNLFIDNGYFDPCPYNENYIVNGLTIEWGYKCFVNPPFSNIKGFVEKAIDEIKFGKTKFVWFLVPLNCDTKWFKLMFPYIKYIVFINGRMHFNDGKYGIPASMALIELSKDSYCPFEQNDSSCFLFHEKGIEKDIKYLINFDK